jgi:hypothetical protein
MRLADNHAGWVVQLLTNSGWIEISEHYSSRHTAEEFMVGEIKKDTQRYWKTQEYRVVEALI